jgi:hypothetical protein
MPSFYTCLCIFALLVNAASLWTAWFVTPKGKSYPFKTPIALIWLLRVLYLCSAFLSYWLSPVVVAITTMSLLAAASNATLIPLYRGLGDEEMMSLAVRNASKEKFWPGLLVRIFPSLFYGILAVFIFFFFPDDTTWGFPIAMGVAYYAIGRLISAPRIYLRLRKLGKMRNEVP